MHNEPIEVETVPTNSPKSQQAAVIRQQHEVGQALSPSQISERLAFIRKVMQTNMTEGVDFGKIPGCGDKPGLFQPGAQKLALTFQLAPIVDTETLTDLGGWQREYAFTLSITAPTGRVLASGVGTCSTLEAKYRYRGGSRKCPACGKETIIKGKKEYGGGWICFSKKGGCGAKYADGAAEIENQSTERVEHDNPADHWNTVRKMAFKRALVHGMINATNTSELWSQDLEDLAANKSHAADADDGDLGPQRTISRPQANKAIRKGASAAPVEKPVTSRPASTPASTAPSPSAEKPKAASPATREWMISQFQARKGESGRELVTAYFRAAGCLLPTEELEDLPLRFVAISHKQVRDLGQAIAGFESGNEAERAFVNAEDVDPGPQKNPTKTKPVAVLRDENVEPSAEGAAWRTFPFPFGKDAGTLLGKMEKNRLYGWWANYEVQESFETGNGETRKKSADQLAKDRKLRAMLDEAGSHYAFKLPEESGE